MMSDKIKTLGQEMALAVNGGNWDTDYSEAQRMGWYLKAQWVLDNLNRIAACA
jgi:hypothetical protein